MPSHQQAADPLLRLRQPGVFHLPVQVDVNIDDRFGEDREGIDL